MVRKQKEESSEKWMVEYAGTYSTFDHEEEAEKFYHKKKEVAVPGLKRPKKIKFTHLRAKTARKKNNPYYKHAVTKQNKDKAINAKTRI
jgi:hypothetical protein